MATPIRDEGATVEREYARGPPVHRVVAPGVADGARERAEDDDDQARGDGLLDLPPTGEQEPRHEDDPASHPDEPGENPADDPDGAQKQ